MLSRISRVVIVSVGLACSATALADHRYQVTELGGEYVYATGLNESNEVVGFVNPNDSWRESYAFLWTLDSGLTSLGGYAASDINELGQIAGNSARLQAAVWENGAWVTLENRQSADAINNYGQVTGLISAQPSIPGPYAPFRDDDIHSPGFIELERPYERASHGYDINDNGEIVADCGTLTRLYVGVFYRSDTSYVVLDNDNNYDAHAQSINNHSQIVGNTTVGFHTDHLAAYWDSPTGNLEYMGSLGDGWSVAVAINNSGLAVGRSADRAFLWSRDEAMVDLNTLIDDELDVSLTRATDINDKGAIVTLGIDANGRKRSYLLTPSISAEIRIVPRTLNLHSKGRWITAHIRLPQEYDVVDVDTQSIRLEDEIEPERVSVDEQEQVIRARFPRAELASVLDESGRVELTVDGNFGDGSTFEGQCLIRVLGRRSGR